MTQEFSVASRKRSAENAVLCRMFQALVAKQQYTMKMRTAVDLQQDLTTGPERLLPPAPAKAIVESSAHGRAAEGKPPRVAANQNFRCEVCNLGVGTLPMFKKHLESR